MSGALDVAGHQCVSIRPAHAGSRRFYMKNMQKPPKTVHRRDAPCVRPAECAIQRAGLRPAGSACPRPALHADQSPA